MRKSTEKKDGSIKYHQFDIHYSALTDKGLLREANEDAFLILDEKKIFCIADGAGGHDNGARASYLTVESIKQLNTDESTDETLPLNFNQHLISNSILEKSIQLANTKIYRERINDIKMASTLVSCQFIDNNIQIFHVGDSRLYRYRERNLECLTEDHSYVNELLKNGIITKAQMHNHPKRNVITRALGAEKEVAIDFKKITPKINDIYLLCSDGITSMLSDSQLLDNFKNYYGGSITELTEKIVKAANDSGGRDNITVILIRISSPNKK